jgi:hypothetical protein
MAIFLFVLLVHMMNIIKLIAKIFNYGIKN